MCSGETFGKLSFTIIWKVANVSNAFVDYSERIWDFFFKKEIIQYVNKSNNHDVVTCNIHNYQLDVHYSMKARKGEIEVYCHKVHVLS